MRNSWILDVLDDLTAFARQNDLPALAAQLEDTAIVATAEIHSNTKAVPETKAGFKDEGLAGTDIGSLGTG